MGSNHVLNGWLPIRLTASPEGIFVRWLNVGSRPLSEPFFHQTLSSLRSQRPQPAELVTDEAVLLDYAATLPAVAPASVIVHVSKCGSTFLTNVLRTGEEVVVLSEAQIITSLLNPNFFRGSSCPLSQQGDMRSALLAAVACVFTHYRGGVSPRLVMKGNAASMLYMSLLRATWPRVPCLVVIRDPIEVLSSMLAAPGRSLREPPVQLLGGLSMFGWTVAEIAQMSDEEYCARGFGCLCEAAAVHIGDSCRVIDYEQLDLDHIYEIAELLRITLPRPESERIRREVTTYAKDPARRRRFEPDRDRKHRTASDRLQEAVRQWAREPYERLKRMQSWSARSAA